MLLAGRPCFCLKGSVALTVSLTVGLTIGGAVSMAREVAVNLSR